MKPDHVQRGIRSRHARVIGDAPVLGRLGRLRGVDPGRAATGSGKGRRRMRNQSAARRKMIMIWSLALAVVTLLIVGGMMMFWLRGHRDVVAAGHQGGYLLGDVRIVSKFASPSEDEARDLVRRALALRDPKLVEELFRPGDTSAAEVAEFMAGAEARDGRFERMDWLSSMDIDGQLMEGILVVYAGKDGPRERLAFLVPDDNGVWKIDFEAFARSSKPSWKEFLKGDAKSARVRVFVAKDVYFNGPFRDESLWVCYAMTSPESKELLPEEGELLRGYCRVGSAQAKALEKIFETEVRLSRATVEIRKTEGAEFRQFEISRVFSGDWVLPPQPLDEKFD